jgi:SynChlorMet cassette protein ScmC
MWWRGWRRLIKFTKLKEYYSLTLADGITWSIVADDANVADIAKILAQTMRLKPANIISQRHLVLKNGHVQDRWPSLSILTKNNFSSPVSEKPVIYKLFPAENNDILSIQLLILSLAFCSQAEANGGLLVHGALAEKEGQGIILAGPGDVGKTTASRRLPPPWKSLSDDCTLIVLDNKGTYHAHPWPTWSTFMFGGTGDCWDVQYSVPLKTIFLLTQEEEDNVKPLGQGHAACMLNETAEQAWWVLSYVLEDMQIRQNMNLQSFNNICELLNKIPVHQLSLSKKGPFWKKMEMIL